MIRFDTLLISSTNQEHRQQLRAVFQDSYHLLESSGAVQMQLLLNQNRNCIAAVLLDSTDLEAADFFQTADSWSREILGPTPLIVLAQDEEPVFLNRVFRLGASDVIPLNYDAGAMLQRVANIVELHLHRQHLETLVQEQKNQLRITGDTVVDALSSIIEYRSLESGQHILRIRHFTKILLEEVAKSCPEYGLDAEQIAIICSASALHDIGKIAIPDAILTKPSQLTEAEMETMKSHTVTGCRILESLADMADRKYLHYAGNICRYHHERWDGRGYPEGLQGESIPICAQVVGLSDAYDALTTDRVYKQAIPHAQAMNMLFQGECGAFSPKLMECFKQVAPQFQALAQAYADGMSPNKEQFTITPPETKPEPEEDALAWLRGKYHALIHYINGLLMELDMDRGLFHLIYNPYPELASLKTLTTLEELQEKILGEYIHSDETARMIWFLQQEITRFLNEGLRRASYRFRIKSRKLPDGEPFEITLLRVNPLNPERRTMAVLAKRIPQPEAAASSMIGSVPEWTYCCRNDSGFTLLQLSDETKTLAGYFAEEIQDRFGGQLLELVHPEDRDRVRQAFSQQFRESSAARLEYRLVCKDGTSRWVYNISRLALDGQGHEIIYSILVDTSHSMQANAVLEDKLQRYEIILAQTENVLFEWDVTADTITFSDTWEKIFGYMPMERNVYRSVADGSFFHPDDLPLLLDRIHRLEKGSPYEMVELRIATAAGRYLWCRFRATAIRDQRGTLQKICGIIINIHGEKQAEQALQSRAEQDSLTRLLNKEAARNQAEAYFARYPEGIPSALLIIDLDNFKQVNDQYGHLFGDTVLTQTAREIKKLFRGQDIVARIGGDEFLVLMRGVSDRQLLTQRCQRLLVALQDIFRSDRKDLPLSCSVGVALSPDHGKSYFELYQHADQALYQAKALGKNRFMIYDPMQPSVDPRITRERIRSTIDSDREPGLTINNFVQNAFQMLYTSKNVNKSVNDLLALVGQNLNVSRVYVFENSEDDRLCSNTYEWCNTGVVSQIQNLQNIRYEEDIPGYRELYNEQGILYCPDIRTLPKPVYQMVRSQNIKSMIHCAMQENGVFRGYVGFDDCAEQRLWTREQIGVLVYFAEALSMFLLRQRRQKRLQRRSETLHSILDDPAGSSYVVTADTYRLCYGNSLLQQAHPNVKPGALCYEAIAGRESPCPQCPVNRLRGTSGTSFLTGPTAGGRYHLTQVRRICWEGENAVLITETVPEAMFPDTDPK